MPAIENHAYFGCQKWVPESIAKTVQLALPTQFSYKIRWCSNIIHWCYEPSSSSSSSSSPSALLLWSWIQFKDYISSSWDFRKCFPSSPLLNMSEQIYCRTNLHNATQQDHISNNLFSAPLCPPKYSQTVDDWPMDCIHCVQMPSLFIQRCKNWTECLKMELEVFQYI